MKFIDWSEVKQFHKVISGISTKNGEVRSILCNPGKKGLYPDIFQGDTLKYYVGASTQTMGIKALFRAIETQSQFKVFEKVAPNQWADRGSWRATDVGEQDKNGFIPFLLRKQ